MTWAHKKTYKEARVEVVIRDFNYPGIDGKHYVEETGLEDFYGFEIWLLFESICVLPTKMSIMLSNIWLNTYEYIEGCCVLVAIFLVVSRKRL